MAFLLIRVMQHNCAAKVCDSPPQVKGLRSKRAGRAYIFTELGGPMATQAPLEIHKSKVLPEWIDYNGHMNLAFYLLAFDQATDTFFDYLGIGESYKNKYNYSTFTLEGHITYDNEVLEGDSLSFKTYLLDFDEKRIHYFHEMYHAREGYLAATNEMITMHIDMSIRRSAPFAPELLSRLQEVMKAHRDLPKPPQVGRTIGIRRK
jgi:acyl-CoA thioester hydrolase